MEGLGVLNETIVFFTSDNGYHLGEHKLPFGKGKPYDTDVRLPMYVTGPGVSRGVTLPHPTTHLDITATLVELAGAKPTGTLDGKSFASELAGEGGADGDAWRQFSFSEFFAADNTWQLVRVVNSSHKLSYVRWCTNETEVFDIQQDPWQAHNLAGSRAVAQIEKEFLPVAAALGQCAGAACSSLSPDLEVARQAPPLPCYPSIQAPGVVASFNLVGGKKVKAVHGWVVDFMLDAPKGKPRGWPAVTVRLLLDHRYHPKVPMQVANMSRPDIMKRNPAIPNPDHGFVFTFPEGFLPPKGKHTVEVVAWIDGQPHKMGPKNQPLRKCFCELAPCNC